MLMKDQLGKHWEEEKIKARFLEEIENKTSRTG